VLLSQAAPVPLATLALASASQAARRWKRQTSPSAKFEQTALLRNVFQLLRVPQHRCSRRLAWQQVIAAAQAVACDAIGLANAR
jgi:hypothetical protein